MTKEIKTLLSLRETLPPVFSRIDAARLAPIYAAQTLRNLDCLGKGPPKIHIGPRVFYEREGFVSWLEARVKIEVAKK